MPEKLKPLKLLNQYGVLSAMPMAQNDIPGMTLLYVVVSGSKRALYPPGEKNVN